MARKGELSDVQLDRRWPHQVSPPADRCTGQNYVAIQDFCRGLTLAPRGHTYSLGGVYWSVFCFALVEHAEAFVAEFGGRVLDVEERPRWPGRKRRAAKATSRESS